MGITFVAGTLTGPGGDTAEVEFMVDSGATYSVVPYETWQRLGIRPKRRVTLRLADGTEIQRAVGECHFTFEQGDGTSPVILGEPGDTALLGAVTLEVIGLVLNPLTRTLHPMQMLLGFLGPVPGRGSGVALDE